jgi:uncharacterized protein (TIGR02145 family)
MEAGMLKKTFMQIYPFIFIGMIIIFVSCSKNSDNGTDPGTNTDNVTVTDIDGNVYHTVKLGTQIWMLENLKVTKYRDGSPIPNVTDAAAWNKLATGAYCDYNNASSNSTKYGRLYNFFVISDSRNVAPAGWHVPTYSEFRTLDNTLESNYLSWSSLSLLYAGYRDNNGEFSLLGDCTYFWISGTVAVPRKIQNYIWGGYVYGDTERYGCSIRCVKD